MNSLMIDVGNSRIKYSKSPYSNVIETTGHDDASPLLAMLAQSDIQHCYVTAGRSSQAQKSMDTLRAWAKKQAVIMTMVTVESKLLAINYAHTEQFGVDRFLHLLAAKARYESYFCVVSAGTALTLDFYTKRHIGGMIFPGFSSARALLVQKTGLPHWRQPTEALGDDTASCIGAGLYYGYQRIIEGSIAFQEQRAHHDFRVIITGGDADKIPICATHRQSLLFEGMQRWIVARDAQRLSVQYSHLSVSEVDGR